MISINKCCKKNKKQKNQQKTKQTLCIPTITKTSRILHPHLDLISVFVASFSGTLTKSNHKINIQSLYRRFSISANCTDAESVH